MSIKNFRCFEELHIEPLARINLLAGKNNVGKTALLEALFLHLGPHNPELPLRLSTQRGIERYKVDPLELWGWNFRAKDISQAIMLSSTDHGGVPRVVSLRLDRPQSQTSTARRLSGADTELSPASLSTTSTALELVIESRIGRSKARRSKAAVEGAEIKNYPSGAPANSTAYFLGTRVRIASEVAEQFSRLDAVGRQDEIIRPLRLLEPRLKRLALLVHGGVSMLHGDIGIAELVPLPLMGEGMVRLLSILLAITAAKDGVVLVDEVENGIHYSGQENVWRAIDAATSRSNVQLFASTHSLECIRAAHSAFGRSDSDEFRLFRLGQSRNGIEAFAFSRDELDTALQTDLEVR
jgi:hypothetical protein